jgi:hypothetical protein
VKVAREAHIWDRSDDEWYQEPADVTTALLKAETFTGAIWDPCCGGGNILRAVRDAGHSYIGTDIVDRDRGDLDPDQFNLQDFLTTPPSSFLASNIIMNPPFARGVMTEAFIRHALKGPNVRKVAAFVDVRFLNSSKRAGGLYAELPPSKVWIITPRPSCPPGAYLAAGNKAGGGTADFCWLVWDRVSPGWPTQLGWLRRAS